MNSEEKGRIWSIKRTKSATPLSVTQSAIIELARASEAFRGRAVAADALIGAYVQFVFECGAPVEQVQNALRQVVKDLPDMWAAAKIANAKTQGGIH